MKTKIHVSKAEYHAGYKIFITQEGRYEEDIYIGTLTMKKIEYGEIVQPTMFVNRLQISAGDNPVQGLMDNLWEIGLRPSSGVSNAGQLQATQDHLKDMQQISFDLLKRINIR